MLFLHHYWIPLLIVNWYHQMLTHVGMTKSKATISTIATIATHFYHPTLKARMEKYIVSICEACQNIINYLVLVFGELPPRNALLLQWSEVTVDFIGPWKITVAAQTIEFRALT